MSDAHAADQDHHGPATSNDEDTLPDHVRPIARFFMIASRLLMFVALGYLLVHTYKQGFNALGAWILFVAIYAASIWHANALTLEHFDD